MKEIKNKHYMKIKASSVISLKLKGNELVIYSIIENIASISEEHIFKGSITYLMAWSGCSKKTVLNVLNSLVNKKIIIKINSKDYRNRSKPIYKVVQHDSKKLSIDYTEDEEEINIDELLKELEKL